MSTLGVDSQVIQALADAMYADLASVYRQLHTKEKGLGVLSDDDLHELAIDDARDAVQRIESLGYDIVPRARN